VERGVIGGTCLNVGCVPSKTLLAASGQREHALRSPFGGVPTSAGPVDLASVVAQKDRLVGGMRQAKYVDVATAHGFEVRAGQASFARPELMMVDGEPLPAAAYVIATGSVPAVPDLPDLDTVDHLTSTTAMELTVLPETLLVVGGGYVGMEQAQMFAGLGTRVTLVGRLAPHTEPEMAAVMRDAFARSGITVVEERAAFVSQDATGQVTVTTTAGTALTADRVLVATGRAAWNRPASTSMTGASSWWTRRSGRATHGCGPPETSAAPRSTSTSPLPPGGSPPRTPSGRTAGSTGRGCPR